MVQSPSLKLPLILSLIFLLMLFAFDRSIISFALFNVGKDHKIRSAEIESTLKLYNACFQDFYASGGQHAKLDDFPAAKPVKHELFRDIGFLSNNGRVMVYDAADVKVLKLRMTSPKKAEVDVFEEWNYLYQQLPERTQLTKVRGLGQGFRYSMQQVRGRWLVLDWEPMDSKVTAGKDDFLF